jgi:catechol 2,3-dioxygenase-like lactoylglutathione lyase family enzyme
MATVQVRYIVRDVDASIKFYCQHLGFREVMHPSPAFAMLERGDLRLVLSKPNPEAGGGQGMPDGTEQEPGGWNRFSVEVKDIEITVAALRKAASHFGTT